MRRPGKAVVIAGCSSVVDEGAVQASAGNGHRVRSGMRARAPHQDLSPREFQVLQGLLAGDALNAIADRLQLRAKTVSNYQSLIRKKLGVGNAMELFAMRSGTACSSAVSCAIRHLRSCLCRVGVVGEPPNLDTIKNANKAGFDVLCASVARMVGEGRT